jgi:integrase
MAGVGELVRSTRCAVRHPGRRGEGQSTGLQPCQGRREPAKQDHPPSRVPVRRRCTPAGRRIRGAPRAGSVLAYCGLRCGEAVALRVRDVQFLRRRLSVSANAVQLGVNHAVGPTKGRKARSVPVPAFVLDELSVQCQGKAPRDLCSPGRPVNTCHGPSQPMGGSRLRCARPGSRTSRRTICGTRVRRWRCQPASTCWRCNACSAIMRVILSSASCQEAV